jgi:hypothetical protein
VYLPIWINNSCIAAVSVPIWFVAERTLLIEIYCRCAGSSCSKKAVCIVCLNTRRCYVIIEESSYVSYAPNSMKEAKCLNIYRLRTKRFAQSISMYSKHTYHIRVSVEFCTTLSYAITNHLYVLAVILTKCTNILVQHLSKSTFFCFLFHSVYNPCFTCRYSTGYLQDLFQYQCFYVCLFVNCLFSF